MTVNDLKPCPFCGGKAILYVIGGDYGTNSYVYCVKCHSRGSLKTSYDLDIAKESAMQAWNRRVEDSE